MKTELLLSQALAATNRGKYVVNVLADFFKEIELDWSMLVGCTTDGAPAMLGGKSGFQAYVKDVARNTTFVHCFIHRFVLCTKVFPSSLLSCLHKIIKIVNFIKTSAFDTRLFGRLCQDVGSDHQCLLFHAEVRWLSRRNMSRRVFELRHELLIFLKKKNQECKDNLENDEFISRLAYLSDIFQIFNHINLSFQGLNSNITDFISKLEAFIRNLDVWTKNLERKHFGMFQLFTTLPVDPNAKLSQEIDKHLNLLRTEMMHYFPDLVSCTYAVNPFCTDPALLSVETEEQEEITDLQVDNTAKAKHTECSPISFWLVMGSTYPTLAKNAIPQLLVFPSTWECEQGFSALMAVKCKSRNRLTEPGHDFRCAVSNTEPRIDHLVQKKQM